MTEKIERVRAFVAVDLDEPARRLVAEAQEFLRQRRFDVRWVERENLHLTVQFLGEIPEVRVPAVLEAMRAAVAGVEPFSMEIRRLSWFPPRRPPRVIFAEAIEPEGRLARIHERLLEALERLDLEWAGTDREDRFHAHVTLGRVRIPRGVAGLEEAIGEARLETCRSEVRALVLKRSDLGPKGPRYTDLGEAILSCAGRDAAADGDERKGDEKERMTWQ
jgi:2'-5' RNA ligase